MDISEKKTYLNVELKKAEKNILSAFIYYYPEVIQQIDIVDISQELFQNIVSKTIFKALLKETSNNGKFDILLLHNSLKTICQDEELLNKCSAYLTSLTKEVQYYNILKYVNLLQENLIKNNLNKLSNEILKTPLSVSNFNFFLEKWEKKFMDIATKEKSINFSNAADVIKEFDHLIYGTDTKYNFLKTGYGSLDEKIKGFKPGQFLVIASRPGVGKTTFALNLIYNNLKHLTKNSDSQQGVIGIFSLEMSNVSLIEKLVAIDSKIELFKLQKLIEGKKLQDYEINIINNSKKVLKNSNLLFCDESNITIGTIISTIKFWVKQYDVKLIVIDYLQLVNLPFEKETNNLNQYQKIGIISRQLKILSLDLNICILALAQLNRKLEDRKSFDKSPILSDLRESGSIEQDADIVIFLYQDNNKNKFDDISEPINESSESKVVLKIGKNRHGPVGIINFEFDKNYGIFTIQ